jgi:hypothetical protein
VALLEREMVLRERGKNRGEGADGKEEKDEKIVPPIIGPGSIHA